LSKDREGMPNYHGFRTDTCVVVPIKTSVSFIVRRRDVIHAWTVPRLGMKIDAVPGRINIVRFRRRFSGVWFGQCSEICGVNHSFMPINVALIDRTRFMRIV
jgi:heme/copper-type cytochrome/quinol oxidase subunit 2